MSSSIIAIDLGTTCSSVGVWKNGGVIIFESSQGNNRIPTCVAFTEKQYLTGNAAKAQGSVNPSNTIFDAKRLIGRRFDDPEVQANLKLWPFKVVNAAGKPKIEVRHADLDEQQFDAEEIISMVLRNMREIADENLGEKVTKAVITVPSGYGEAQRRATVDAGTKAGLEVLRIVNNPSAVALAYSFTKKIEQDINMLVFDLGGGTLDVSVISVDANGIVEVRSTAGNTYLGGQDFDSRLVRHFCKVFNNHYKKNISNDPRALWRLRTAAKHAKCILSRESVAHIDIKKLYQGQGFKTKITRSRFEELCADLFRSTLMPVEKALQDAQMPKHAINKIVLAGGSSKIPKIQQHLRDFFNGKTLDTSMTDDVTVAVGAAIQAAILAREDLASPVLAKTLLLEIAPSSIGVKGPDNTITNIIDRNSGIPTRIRRRFTTTNDNQTKLMIQIYEGEDDVAVGRNKLMKNFKVSGIQPARKGVPRVELQFQLDLNGFLHVSAVQSASGHAYDLTESSFDGPVNQAEAAEVLSDDESDVEEDSEDAILLAKQQLNSYVLQVKQTALNSISPGEVRNQIINFCNEIMRWMERNPKAGVHDYDDQSAALTAALSRWK